jgi:hypothetical protein
MFLEGPVERDVLVGSGLLTLDNDASVAGDVIAGGGEVNVLSPVDGNLHVAAGSLDLNCAIGGNVLAHTGKLFVGDKARIGGVLRFASGRATDISSAAKISDIVRLETLPEGQHFSAIWFLVGWLRLAVGMFVLGLLVRLLCPRFTRKLPQTFRRAPWRSFGIGAAVLCGVPVAAWLLFFFGALVGGWWLGLLVIGFLGAAIAISFPMVGMAVVDWLFERAGRTHVRRIVSLLLGVVLLALLVRLPIVGEVVGLAIVLFGLGALTLTGMKVRSSAAGPLETP